jgi:O-antigen/teichoic acid export membrane protein
MSDAAAGKTFWAFLDQGVISAGNFCTNLILIRTLPENEFGVFALLLNAMLFLNNVHASTVTYTVLIRGAQADEELLGKVATGGLLATLGMAVLNVILLCFATSYVAHRELLLFVVGASLCWQIQEALRTVFISRLHYSRAIPGDAVSYLGQSVVLALFCYFAKPSLPAVFLIIAGTSLLGALLQGVQIRPNTVSLDWMTSFRNDVWLLGRWSVLAKLVAFFSLQAFPWFLAYRQGLVAVAAFQSLYQLVALMNPILLSSNNLIMASIAGHVRQRGASLLTAASKYMFLSSSIVTFYFVVLLLGGSRVMSFFYGRQSAYLSNAPLLPIFAFAYGLEFVSMFAGAILAGMEKTRPLFFQQLWGTLVAVCLVLPLIARFGLRAAVSGLLLVNAAKAISGWYLVYVARSNMGKAGEARPVFAAL